MSDREDLERAMDEVEPGLKALDPETGQPVPITIGRGEYWTVVCTKCGRENGLWIVMAETPRPEKPWDCPGCDGVTKWEEIR